MKVGDLVYISEKTIWARPWRNQYCVILNINLFYNQAGVRTFNSDHLKNGIYHSNITVELNCLVEI